MKCARLLVVALVLFGGCGVGDPEIGAEVDAGVPGDSPEACGLLDSDLERSVGWAAVHEAVFSKRCGCHTTPGGLGVTVTGFDLSNRAAALKGGRNSKRAVVPGSPCESLVLAKTSSSPPFGSRMPLNGVPLSEGDRQLVVDWIAEGARP
ncbi:MAG: hypothetical protein ACOYM9_17800 [Bradymonadia bacterium]